jgi:hypothetical protein
MNETKKSQHTPGPWRAEVSGDTVYITSETYGDVARVREGDGDDRREANIRLIAAAPELLEALDGILNNLWEDRKRNVKRDYSLMVYEAQAKAAIAKAKGE